MGFCSSLGFSSIGFGSCAFGFSGGICFGCSLIFCSVCFISCFGSIFCLMRSSASLSVSANHFQNVSCLPSYVTMRGLAKSLTVERLTLVSASDSVSLMIFSSCNLMTVRRSFSFRLCRWLSSCSSFPGIRYSGLPPTFSAEVLRSPFEHISESIAPAMMLFVLSALATVLGSNGCACASESILSRYSIMKIAEVRVYIVLWA